MISEISKSVVLGYFSKLTHYSKKKKYMYILACLHVIHNMSIITIKNRMISSKYTLSIRIIVENFPRTLIVNL